MLAVPQPVKNIQMQVQVNTEVLVKFSAYHDGQQGRNGKTGLNLWLIAQSVCTVPLLTTYTTHGPCMATPTRHHVACSRISDGGKEGKSLGLEHGGIGEEGWGTGESLW